LNSILESPLGQMSLEKGGLTIVELDNAGENLNQAPSFIVPPSLTQDNPALANSEAGSLVLVTSPNPKDPNDQLVHVYRVSAPPETVSSYNSI